MLSFLKPKAKSHKVPADKVMPTYKKLRFISFLGVFLGYMAFYIVRNNISLSSSDLKASLGISKTQMGAIMSYMLLAYGLSKGFMSSLSDKADPKKYMALGLFLCASVNLVLGVSHTVFLVSILVILLGLFQGMGVGPAFITLASWYPKKERGRMTALWNISHNIGGGIVASVVTLGFFIFGKEHWKLAYYVFPAIIAIIFVIIILVLVKGKPENEGLPTMEEITGETQKVEVKHVPEEAANLSARQIFVNYVLKNKHAWYVSLVDTFVYLIRFGLISWLPIYLLETKGFTKGQMGIAFTLFEWAAIPSTLLAGYLSDKVFKGYRMPPAIGAMVIIFFCLIGYWESTSLVWVIVFASLSGCLIYVPQFLASVQTMEVVPSFAVGNAVGLRGFMSYIVGASFGTWFIGFVVDRVGWSGGLYVLLSSAVLCIVFAVLSHRGAKELAHK